MRLQKNCLHCDKELTGRTDKKYCDIQCKGSYQYRMSRERPERFFDKVDNQLKLNRKILKKYNRSGMSTVRASVIIAEGFNPKFFTHYWKNKKGDVYLFVYEYGFLNISDKHKEKFVLIQWQNYMER